MKIAVVKPDYNIRGGFEIVVDKIEEGLLRCGHDVDIIKVDMTREIYNLGPISIPPHIYAKNREFFRYVTAIQKFRELNLKKYDIVIATQPPSFAVNHSNVAVLFYHHLKICYDLSDVYIDCATVDRDVHIRTRDLIREIDSYFITKDKYYIAGSRHVAKRLNRFNGIQGSIPVFWAGVDEEYYDYAGEIYYRDPICVGRHEFPKRTELFIHAMKHVDGVKGRVIGSGGRTGDLQRIDRYLTLLHKQGRDIDDEYLWKKLIFDTKGLPVNKRDGRETNIVFTGSVGKAQLIREYASALCVVCPAYEEDYGLTAVEGMCFHKPVIACTDGGGYSDIIEHGENGYIVEPEGEAIADAINELKSDPDKLKYMGNKAFETSRKYSWKRAISHLNSLIKEAADRSRG